MYTWYPYFQKTRQTIIYINSNRIIRLGVTHKFLFREPRVDNMPNNFFLIISSGDLHINIDLKNLLINNYLFSIIIKYYKEEKTL